MCWLKSVLHEEKRRTGSDSGRTNATKTMSDVFRHRSRTGKSYCRTRSDSMMVKKEQSYIFTPPMGRTACTEPQCLYKSCTLPFFHHIINSSILHRMDLQEVGGCRGDWMELGQDRDSWRALMGTVRDLRVP
jgi:hypothetical protein